MSDQQPKQSRLPSVDPGLASIVAAVLTLIGVIVTVLVQRDPGPVATPAPVAIVVDTPTSEPFPTATDTPPTQTPEPTATEPPPTPSPSPKPTDVLPTDTPVSLAPTPPPSVISLLPPNQAASFRDLSAQAIVQAAEELPLLVRDDFETRDYGWIELEQVIQGGGECRLALEEGTYQIEIQSASGAMWCTGGLPRLVSDFYMSVDLGLAESRLSDILVFYRTSPDQQSYYSVGINPTTQQFWVNVVDEGENIPIVPPTLAEHINQEGINRITIVATGYSHALILNDQLDVLFTDDRLDDGTFGVNLWLQESNANETLFIDNFLLRGN